MQAPPLDPDETRPIDAHIAEQLAARGYAIVPGFLEPAAVAALAAELGAARARGALRPAGIGRGAELRIAPEIRGDRVLWLEPETAAGPERALFERTERLRLALNRALTLGLFGFEAHYALFPPGAFYRAHVDRFSSAPHRALTVTLYLNAGWLPEDEGALRLYLEGRTDGAAIEVLPHGGTLVVFLPDGLLHEVLTTRRERLSVAGWFTRRA